MNEPDWAKVLSELYYKESNIKLPAKEEEEYSSGPSAISVERMDSELIDGTGLSAKEIKKSVEFLAKQKLITAEAIEYARSEGGKLKDPQNVEISLTTDGFDVAHEREISKSQLKTSKRSTRLSGYLVLAIVLQATISILQPIDRFQLLVLGLSVTLIAFVIGVETYAQGI